MAAALLATGVSGGLIYNFRPNSKIYTTLNCIAERLNPSSGNFITPSRDSLENLIAQFELSFESPNKLIGVKYFINAYDSKLNKGKVEKIDTEEEIIRYLRQNKAGYFEIYEANDSDSPQIRPTADIRIGISKGVSRTRYNFKGQSLDCANTSHYTPSTDAVFLVQQALYNILAKRSEDLIEREGLGQNQSIKT